MTCFGYVGLVVDNFSLRSQNVTFTSILPTVLLWTLYVNVETILVVLSYSTTKVIGDAAGQHNETNQTLRKN